jgi:hypothetical protein
MTSSKKLHPNEATRNAARLLRELADVFEALPLAPPATPLRVRHDAWGMPRRRAAELARSGAIAAVKIGRAYYATPAELERFFSVEQPSAPVADPLEAVRALGRRAAR